MRLESLSDIGLEKREWAAKQSRVYRKLKLWFLVHEVVQNSKFILLLLIGFWFYQPIFTPWLYKILWQLRFLTQNAVAWVIP